MTERVVADAEQIDVFAVELRRITEEIAVILAAFDDDTRALRGGWTGAASDAYDRARTDWRDRMDRAEAVLARATTQVAVASTAFADTERANTARW